MSTREKAEKILRETASLEGFDDVREVINAYLNPWISVKEGLPEGNTQTIPVLVRNPHQNYLGAYYATFHNYRIEGQEPRYRWTDLRGDQFNKQPEYLLEFIEYWFDIPNPPKE